MTTHLSLPKGPRDVAASHPFVGWFGNLSRWGARLEGAKDFVLDRVSSQRFALAGEAGDLVLGLQPKDMKALETIPWATSALIRGLKGSDWIALSSPDIRPGVESLPFDVEADDPVPLRLFIEIASDRADAIEFSDPQPGNLRLRVFSVRKGKALAAVGEPAAILPFAVRKAGRAA